MESFSMMDAVVNELKQDSDLMRIKKIIYCACAGRWENDESKLEEINLRELIEELYEKTGNRETLDHRLSRIVSKVNKKTEYGLLANKIIENVGRLYPEEEDDVTIMESTPIWEVQESSGEATVSKEKLVDEIPAQREPENLFNVREKIMRGTNPLKAKILIFSTVEHQFNFGERDWLLLKTKSLDSLLRQIFNLCTSVTDLESSLYSAANNFEDPDEYTQIAHVIISALNPCYSSAVISTESDDEQVEAAAPEPEIIEAENDGDLHQGNILFSSENYSLIDNNEDKSSPQSQQSVSLFDYSIGERSEENTGETGAEKLEGLMYTEKSVSLPRKKPIQVSLDNSRQGDRRGGNILDSIKQKLELEAEISALVNQRIEAMIDAVEKQFVDLEETLNEILQNEQKEQRLFLKYKALGDFIGNIQEKSTKFKEVLKQFEIEERKKLNQENSSNILATKAEAETNSFGENKQKILELAMQGNPKAVALIINQSLHSTGINVIAGIKDGYLHIILESDPVPNQQVLALFVEKKITSLKSESLKNVKIHGRKSGNKSIVWTQTIK